MNFSGWPVAAGGGWTTLRLFANSGTGPTQSAKGKRMISKPRAHRSLAKAKLVFHATIGPDPAVNLKKESDNSYSTGG